MDGVSAFARRWVSAWNSRDADRVVGLYMADGVHRMSAGSPYEGSDAIGAMVRRSLDAYPDLSFSVRDSFGIALGAGWRIVIEYTMRGTQTGEINGREGSGRPIEVDGALVATLGADLRISEVIDYVDHHAIRVQQGGGD